MKDYNKLIIAGIIFGWMFFPQVMWDAMFSWFTIIFVWIPLAFMMCVFTLGTICISIGKAKDFCMKPFKRPI